MTSIIGMLVGVGLFVGGAKVHDENYRDGYQFDLIRPSDHREHYGYLMGVVGGACFALSLKHLWNQREKSASLSSNHTRIYTGVSRSREARASGDAWRHEATLRSRFPHERSEITPLGLITNQVIDFSLRLPLKSSARMDQLFLHDALVSHLPVIIPYRYIRPAVDAPVALALERSPRRRSGLHPGSAWAAVLDLK